MISRATPGPFDRVGPSQSTLRVIIGPTALAEATPSDLDLMAAVAAFRFVDMVFVPCDDVSRAALARVQVAIAEIELRRTDYVFEYPNGSCSLTSTYVVDDTYKRQQSGPPNAWIDHMLADHAEPFDVVVASPASIQASAKPTGRGRLCTLREFWRRARLFGVASGDFRVLPNFRVNEGMYYLYRLYLTFPEAQRAWIVVATCRMNRSGNELQAHVGSLRARLDFLERASDQVCIECLRTSNNDTEARALYSLAYLIILASAALENLASIVRNLHALQSLTPYQTTLRLVGANKRHSELTKALRVANPALHNYLVSNVGRGSIDGIVEIRDQLQHRLFPVPIGRISGLTNRREPGHVQVPDHAIASLAKASRVPIEIETFPPSPGQVLVDPYSFALAVVEVTARLVNDILPLLPWSTIVAAATQREQEHVRATLSKFDQGVGHFLDWGVEPPLFPF
jgi:hypothetical protein